MTTYYIDPSGGNDQNDGLSAERPLVGYAGRKLSGGDTVLFKRGSVIRDVLHSQCGTEGAPITYGAYGEGAKPAFMGSMAVGSAEKWVEEKSSLWRYQGSFPSEVCNLIFNGGESCGNLRWTVDDLRHQGEWHFTLIGWTEGSGGEAKAPLESGILYLYSTRNPGLAYADIECALWGDRQLAKGKEHVVYQDLCFRNAGVHGYQAVDARDVVIRRCDFLFIGGAVWSLKLKIRFGNAVEFWDGASQITVEQCRFDNIYDSGITHQGGLTVHIPHHLYFRDNLFFDCGMSPYECREPSVDVYFEHNTCINSGGGFSPQGEPPPRHSEIHPQPMGHHVFIWRVDPGTQPGAVYVRHNVFFEAPYGAAIYSVIDPADERKMVFDKNIYWQTTGTLLNRLNNRDYLPSEFALYQKECGQDANSRLEKPAFKDQVKGDYRLTDESVAGYRYPL